ncbi:undecaprenyl-diphosphatase UppP [Patescibacteria group bacterium]|nr:undecaprenyl-diphosphatase UppP [Patescibacteria group bacterium]
MNILQAVVLGLVQGATEFIPISSSGHLVLAREVFGWEDPGVVFDIFLHLGTLAAVLIYFRRDWLKIIKDLFGRSGDKRTAINLVVATLPAFILGFLFNDYINSIFRHALWVSTFLIIVGLIFISAEKFASHKIIKKDLDKVSWKDALLIGLVQALALLPGVSRSGITIAAGMFRSLKRTEATRFSFLMASIAILGASIFGSFAAMQDEGYLSGFWPEIVIGSIIAAIVGYLSIKYLMKFLSQHKLYIFAAYLICLGVIIFAVQWIY